MKSRHPSRLRAPPTRWLMTDERMGDQLWIALRRLPRGGGVVFRHHATPDRERRGLFRRVGVVARARGLVLVRAGAQRFAGEQGVHGRSGRGLVTYPVHDRAEARAARRAGALVSFISPVHATRSHPGVAALGPRHARSLAMAAPGCSIALGGMDERRFRRLSGFDGWAAIDAWVR